MAFVNATGPVEIAREEVEIRTEDGLSLRATVVEPSGASASESGPRAVAVLAHAMFARRTQFDKPSRDEGWLAALARAGVRAIAFDFRGHGDSGTPASKEGFWSYDDLVQRDLPAVVAAARDRAAGAPVVVIGHSLGGHVALAAQGTGAIAADALVVVAANLWLPRWDASLARRAVKWAAIEALRRTTARVGYFPARRLRRGSDDEAAPFMHDLVRFVEDDEWKSADGAADYAASLARIAVPVLGFASEADRVQCAPSCARAILAQIPRAELRVVREGDAGPRSAAPSHMELVTRSRAVREAAVRFVAGELGR
jgi:predicted alpha/beta hydrolase